MKLTLTLLTALVLSPLATLYAADNPFTSAKAVWRMTAEAAAGKQPLALKENGPVKFEQLSAAEAAESRNRGGADTAATLTAESFLSLETEKATQLRPTGDALTLYARARFEPGAAGTLFFSDFLTLGVHPSGLAIALLGVQTPQGKVYREIPLATVERGGWLDLVLRVGDGRVEFFCDGELKITVPLRQKLVSPFTNELRLGAMRWHSAKADRGHPNCEFGTKQIATVSLWHRALRDGEIAFLSGVSEVKAKHAASAFDQAILDYNAFFDASIAKDVAACDKLSRSLMKIAARDPDRPSFHLSQPLGWLFDPAGAWFYQGRYHVFSYHNIYARLAYTTPTSAAAPLKSKFLSVSRATRPDPRHQFAFLLFYHSGHRPPQYDRPLCPRQLHRHQNPCRL